MLRLLLKQGKFATYLWSNLRETKFRVTTDTRFAQRSAQRRGRMHCELRGFFVAFVTLH